MSKIIICIDCKEEKPRYAKGLCGACYHRRWARANREERATYQRRWSKENPERRAAIQARRRKNSPERCAARDARRRARKENVANTLTPEQIEFERKIGEATYPGERLHLHHLVPFSKKGGHTWGNIVFIPASLNLSIGDKLPEEAYQQLALNY